MADFDFVIKQGDLLPAITAVLTDAAGQPVDLSGLSVKFIMRQIYADTNKINAAAIVDADQVTNKGKVSYTWQGTDTDTAGVYWAEWQVMFSGSKPETFPNDGQMVVRVEGQLGS